MIIFRRERFEIGTSTIARLRLKELSSKFDFHPSIMKSNRNSPQLYNPFGFGPSTVSAICHLTGEPLTCHVSQNRRRNRRGMKTEHTAKLRDHFYPVS